MCALERLAVEPPFALGVSGGGDSVALMHLVAAWAKARNHDLASIFVLTVDHGLRDGSHAEAAHVGEWARALGFQHRILEWRGEKPTAAIQETARAARYDLLCGWAHDKGVSDLLVAHTADDQAETVGMRLLKGSGAYGLAGMAPDRKAPNGVRILRPLLDLKGSDLRAWLREADHPWLEDPSNQNDHFERVRMRQALAGDASLGQALARLSVDAATGRAALDAAVDDLLRDGAQIRPAGWARLDLGVFRSAPQAVCERGLSRMLMGFGGAAYPSNRAALRALVENLLGQQFSGATLAGCVLAPEGRQCALIGREGRNITSLALTAGQGAVWDHRFEVRTDRDLRITDLGSVGLEVFAKADRERIKAAFPPPLRASAFVLEGADILAVPHAGVGEAGGIEVIFGGFRPFGPMKPGE